MGPASSDLLRGLLKDVSRSFYLTLRVLPGAIRPQIGLAYLLARASDTIADTGAVPKEKRLEVLHHFGARIMGTGAGPMALTFFTGHQSSPAEQILLQRLEEALALLDQLDQPDRELVRQVLETILSGQSLDVERFAEADSTRVAALQTEEELDDYTYRVAGCVGEFWTRMCRAHLFPHARLDDAFLLANGVRFGKGLQLVNILRDLPADLRLGRCYLPESKLSELALRPSDLLDPTSEPRLRPLYERWLDRAREHLEAGWDYTNHLPPRSVRVRLACSWPILIGLQTITKLRASQVLYSAQRVKISRRDVRQIMVRSLLCYPWPRRWRALAVVRKPLPHDSSFVK